MACFLVFAPGGPSRADPCGGGPEACLKAGEQLYRTHHLVPGRYEEAIRLYEQGLDMRPDDYGILWKLSEMYMNYGEMLGPDRKERKITSWTRGAEYGAPKYMEWYGAFGLIVTLVWLYLEMLRLLSKLRSR